MAGGSVPQPIWEAGCHPATSGLARPAVAPLLQPWVPWWARPLGLGASLGSWQRRVPERPSGALFVERAPGGQAAALLTSSCSSVGQTAANSWFSGVNPALGRSRPPFYGRQFPIPVGVFRGAVFPSLTAALAGCPVGQSWEKDLSTQAVSDLLRGPGSSQLPFQAWTVLCWV